MENKLQHEEIVERFAKSGAINFEALGAFVTETGAELAAADGLYGTVVGRFNHLSCFLRPDDVSRVLDGLAGYAALNASLNIPSER